MSRYDVIISGGGPVGSLGALLLAEQGFKVALIEESKQVYPYPRAVSMDAFSLQTVKRLIGKRFDNFPTTPLHRAYYVLDRKDLTTPFAYAEVNDPHLSFVNWFEQPILESFLRETIKENELIDSFYGHSALSIFSNDQGVHLRHMDSETGKIELVIGSYLLGCDGGGSMIRKQVGVSQSQLGASTLFLIVDCKIDREKLCPLPEDLESGAFQIVDQTRPTTFIIMEAKNHGTLKRRVRFEFRLNPGDDFSHMQSKEGLNEILAPYLDTEHVEVQRSTVYKFNSLISGNWRKKNIFVCGDACHQTSPFTGQGMNMGIRNTANLVTKISLVLKGHSDESLLDRYQIECYDTTLDIIKESLFLGKALFNTTLPVNILRNTIHWLRGSGKNPISILDKVLPKPMALPDTLASGLNPFNGMKYASSTPPRGSSLSAYQWVRILDIKGLNSYLMWTSPTRYRIICRDSKPNNIESFEKLPDSIKPLAFVLKEGEDSSQIESDFHFLVPDKKSFNKLFGGGVKYVVMAHQYMMIGTYIEGEEDKMFNDFCGRFDLKKI